MMNTAVVSVSASTTIYGAAVRSNMKILSRYNHAWPSTYCPIGQDAAVSYGSLDLRFQNTSEYPIYIVAGMSGTKLTVTFYGYQDPSYDEIRRHPNKQAPLLSLLMFIK